MLMLGVNDLEASLKFYRDGPGLPTEAIVETDFDHGAIVLFHLEEGGLLGLFTREDLGLNAGTATRPPSSTEFSIGHNVASEAEVDRVLAQAEKAGGRITMPARKTFWGRYSRYF